MGLWELVVALIRRWPVVIVASVLAASLGFLATRDHAVYWTRTEVAFLAPPSTRYPNSLQTRSEDLIITAGVVAKRAVGAGKDLKYGSIEPTLLGTRGATDGYWIRLPDSGGQWTTNFSDQVLLIDVVGSSPERVRQLQEEAISRIRRELDILQDEQEVNRYARIAIRETPELSAISRVGGSRLRALGMILVLGGAATITVVLTLRRRELSLSHENATTNV